VSVGLGLLHKLVTEALPLREMLDHGITRDHFIGDEVSILDAIEAHFSAFGRYPSVRTLEAETTVSFPKFPNEPFSYWVSRVTKRKESSILSKLTKDVQSALSSGDVDGAKDLLGEARVNLTSTSKKIETLFGLSSLADRVVAAHDKRQHGHEMSGIPFGIPYIDELSDGAQPGDTVALVGRPSVGKSYILFSMANSAWNAGKEPLVVSMEMPPVQCARRIIAMRTGMNSTKLRLGRIGFFGRRKLLTDISSLKEMEGPGRHFYILAGSLKSTVEDLGLLVMELKPSALYIDGAYLLRIKSKQNAKWERVSDTAEYLKMMSNELQIPIIATYQFNRRGPGSLGNIGLSDTIGQLASIVIGIDDEEQDQTVFRARQFKLLELLKGREGEKGLIRLLYDMGVTSIRQHSVIKGYRTDTGEEYSTEEE
jgi:replicative DNA helicase